MVPSSARIPIEPEPRARTFMISSSGRHGTREWVPLSGSTSGGFRFICSIRDPLHFARLPCQETTLRVRWALGSPTNSRVSGPRRASNGSGARREFSCWGLRRCSGVCCASWVHSRGCSPNKLRRKKSVFLTWGKVRHGKACAHGKSPWNLDLQATLGVAPRSYVACAPRVVGFVVRLASGS